MAGYGGVGSSVGVTAGAGVGMGGAYGGVSANVGVTGVTAGLGGLNLSAETPAFTAQGKDFVFQEIHVTFFRIRRNGIDV